MKRSEFDHTVRAAGSILGVSKILVIGSQAIHGSVDFLIPEAQRSIEADICALNDTDGSKADLIDGSIGELSVFQETFGYYAHGVTPDSAILPDGWKKRLIPYLSPATNGVTAYCLELHDLWISKAAAGRPKDFDFCRSLVQHQLVKSKTLHRRTQKLKKVNSKTVKAIIDFILDFDSNPIS